MVESAHRSCSTRLDPWTVRASVGEESVKDDASICNIC